MAKPRVLKSTKILMVRSQSYSENGLSKIWRLQVYFICHISIPQSMLQYISSSDSQVSNDLPACFLSLDFINLNISYRSKHTIHAVFQDDF